MNKTKGKEEVKKISEMSDDELIDAYFESRRWDLLFVTVFNRIDRLVKRIKELEKRMTDLENRVTKDDG